VGLVLFVTGSFACGRDTATGGDGGFGSSRGTASSSLIALRGTATKKISTLCAKACFRLRLFLLVAVPMSIPAATGNSGA